MCALWFCCRSDKPRPFSQVEPEAPIIQILALRLSWCYPLQNQNSGDTMTTMPRRHLPAATLGFALLCTTGLSLSAQDEPCLRRSFVVTVTDKNGNPVEGLTAANFHGKFRGKPVKIPSAATDLSQRRVVILYDRSGSMGHEYPLALTIARSLVKFSPASWQIAIVAFSDRPETYLSFGTPREVMNERLALSPGDEGALPVPKGKTAAADAFEAALKLFVPNRAGDTICVISDGESSRSATEWNALEERFLASCTRVFYFRVDSAEARFGRSFKNVNWSKILEMSEVTGGYLMNLTPALLVSPSDNAGLDRNLAIALKMIATGYRLDLELPVAPPSLSRWSLEVVDATRKRMKGIELGYPQKLVPCSMLMLDSSPRSE